VALNLAVSLITVTAAAAIRGSTLRWRPVLDLLPIAIAMTSCPPSRSAFRLPQRLAASCRLAVAGG
jgi:hypothetical protein